MKEQYEMIDTIFRDIFPKEGFNIRERQIELCKHYCDVLNNRQISLSEAGVGLGKTYAYLVACIVNRHFRPVDERAQMNYPYSPDINMPYVIATSSIQLQKELKETCVPKLSKILIKHGIISQPLVARIGKGKKNYICKAKLLRYIKDIQIARGDKTELAELKRLKKYNIIDIDKAHIGLYDKNRISVSSCSDKCRYKNSCRYYSLKSKTKYSDCFVVICNHNYFLADLMHRRDNKKILIPNYRCVIIDECHKYNEAFKSTGMKAIDKNDLTNLLTRLKKALVRCGEFENGKEMIFDARDDVDLIYNVILTHEIDSGIDTTIYISKEALLIINALVRELNSIKAILQSKRATQFVPRIEDTITKLNALQDPSTYFYWVQGNKICFAPYTYSDILKTTHWNKSIPFILTSGTISIDNDFSYFIRTMYLSEMAQHRLVTMSYPSPFDYKKNCLLYYSIFNEDISSTQITDQYIDTVSKEIVDIVSIIKGRTLVLFTSYRLLNMIREGVHDSMGYPLIVSDKGNRNAIDEFRETPNSVLFSTNAWEGVDIQGEQLSCVIIVKLPFPIPTKDSEHVRNQYHTFEEFLLEDIIPHMQIKLRQGFGRLVRHEDDGGIIAILDTRASNNGRYKDFVSQCMPQSRDTSLLDDVKAFMQQRDNQC